MGVVEGDREVGQPSALAPPLLAALAKLVGVRHGEDGWEKVHLEKGVVET